MAFGRTFSTPANKLRSMASRFSDRTYYDDPAFERAEGTMRRRFRTGRARTAHNLRRSGVDAADIPRLMTRQTIGEQQEFSDLVGKQQDIERQRTADRRARRRNRLGRILGTAIQLPMQIYGLRTARRAANNYGSSGNGVYISPR